MEASSLCTPIVSNLKNDAEVTGALSIQRNSTDSKIEDFNQIERQFAISGKFFKMHCTEIRRDAGSSDLPSLSLGTVNNLETSNSSSRESIEKCIDAVGFFVFALFTLQIVAVQVQLIILCILVFNLAVCAFDFDGSSRPCKTGLKCPEVLEETKKEDMHCEIGMLNVMLSDCKTYEECMDVLELPRFNDVKVDEITMNTVLSKCWRFGKLMKVINSRLFASVVMNENLLDTALSRCSTPSQYLSIIKSKRFRFAAPIGDILKILLSKCKKASQCSEILESSVFESSILDEKILDIALQKCRRVEECMKIIESSQFKSISSTEKVLTLVLKRCTTVKQCVKVMESSQFRFSLNEDVLSMVRSKCITCGFDLQGN